MFENEIVTRVSRITTNEILDALGENGQYIEEFDILTIKTCKKIIDNFDRYSDLLYCINTAISKKESILRYKLQLPYTLTQNDVEILTELLVKINLLKGVFYSSINNSYLIEINVDSDLFISKILTIGCAEKFLNKQSEIFVGNKSFLLIDNDKIIKYHIELSAGLEINVASHPTQVRSLIKKINKKQTNISDYYIVSHFIKTNLNLFDNVISLTDYLRSCI